ncbi:MAG: ATP synthase F1 subunit gamma [Planctomycetota bacterium]|nr:MAG: ATP synthase F1 subunit gamma [Planctomycetota bacterium]
MARARAIVKRRRAAQNISKITRTMELIATARFQAAFNRATATKPYAEKLTELVEQLSRSRDDLEHPLLKINTESKRTVLLVITSNHGLCGGYNTSLLEAALEHINQREDAGEKVDLQVMGKKGIFYFKHLGRELAGSDTRFEDKPQFAEVEPIAQLLIDSYQRKQIDSAYVIYMRLLSAGIQRVHTMQLLPIERPTSEDRAGLREPSLQYEFTPPPEELLTELLPAAVKIRLFQCFNEAAVSEQVARMVAMKAATDAANDMIRLLSRQYNRARQAQITFELLDIVSGAEALQ